MTKNTETTEEQQIVNYVRCRLCGTKMTDPDTIEYLDSMPIHKGQLCPIVDPTVRSLVSQLVFGEGDRIRYAASELTKLLDVKTEREVTCKNCGKNFFTRIRGNAAKCTHCGTKQYIPK